ncbi:MULTISPECIES: hypothetical protein [unclassified Robiginitalea]|uniref:hypothetical protein n=1 Tax=Robiginitalea TaxID=252306 RepID=UPI002349FE2D|nr:MULTISPECIES: hypothetical protein [unclassified Robiginitalea]MDC6354120.1 hypothetical protein [Robiginitalea sp. PM2]MDC6374387.1 hypothetical protein [Robiginitalea sp. SP8]
MTKTIDRLIQFINHIGLSARQFDISIGASNGYTLRMKKNHASVGSDVLETVLQTYPDLNVVWLLTGEGVMLKSQMEDEVLDFEKLPAEKKAIIEKIIEDKIRERQHQELRNLVKEVAKEFNN